VLSTSPKFDTLLGDWEMTRSRLFGALLASTLMVAGASSAQAAVIALVIDETGSISATNYALQKTGYINAITDLVQADGLNSIGVWQFNDASHLVYSIHTIATAADKTNLLNALNGMTQAGGTTGIGDAITTAANAITAFGGTGNKIIDVSTDGQNNTGSNPTTAANAAFALGYHVNCLGIGGAADCSFNNGNAALGADFPAATFADFEAALRTKLTAELTFVPEPVTLTIFGAGLLGAAGMRRRLKKA